MSPLELSIAGGPFLPRLQLSRKTGSSDGYFSSTKTLLAELKKPSIKTEIITRDCRAAVLQVFPDIELYADATLTREDSQNVKPHPGHLQKALGILGVSEKEAAMIGDHPTDIMTARQAGSCAVGVLTGSADEKSLRATGADLILANAFAILGHI
ncbi:MAG: HAD-IA family hydrolase [Syntrophales bacterium]|jgi:phosphoglycolate phosphatase|nr:HAD-IA family hydrolase [Syntrophales bacterium]